MVVLGAVQGVGFRPYVFRLATELVLLGWVGNTAQGVSIEVEGPADRVREFVVRLGPERPPHCHIASAETTWLDPLGYDDFSIRPSAGDGDKTAVVLPDLATCPECLAEILDPANRRYRYPFTNCTHCGPRYSILRGLPYDRPNTTMAGFTMCGMCRAEYEDPRNRRFHAQPNACPQCGPQLELWDGDGGMVGVRDEALGGAVSALRSGAVVAIKGLGGFHLAVLAADEAAVRRLRARKRREAKPLAVMFPGIEMVEACCEVGALERRALESAEAPIVLMRRRAGAERWVAGSVAPGVATLGGMLPYSPLHHLLARSVGAPVVATSGNLSDEPICTDEREALQRLGGIADLFLVHNRPIVRAVDDSVVRVMLGRETVLRRARGYAPLPVAVRDDLAPVLAVGGHLKNTVAVGRGGQVFLSQHIGDLETAGALKAFRRVLADLPALFGVVPEVYAADAHPDYLSTQEAQASGRPVLCVQHHYAHVLACMAENDAAAPLLGVSWDGTGFGLDGTIWGGEFLLVAEDGFERVAHLRTFPLPGGDKAVQEPRRSALGLLFALLGEAVFTRQDLAPVQAFGPGELGTLRQMLERGVNVATTSSAGRLFDAVAALTGLRQITHVEGQAAMDLEFALERDESDDVYPVAVRDPGSMPGRSPPLASPCLRHAGCEAMRLTPPRWVLDWGPMVEGILLDLANAVPVWEISARFHNALAEGIVSIARAAGQVRVALTGGCFQNRYLLERTVRQLRSAGFSPYWHQRVPPNDGGIALGQAVAAGRQFRRRQVAGSGA
jgi:hydrogenase maturation protein HypF